MVIRAVEEFDIDTKRSFVIGDRMIDMQLGKSIGATSILVKTGYGTTELANLPNHQIEHVADNLYAAMQIVKRKTSLN